MSTTRYTPKYKIAAIWKTTLLCLSLSIFSCAKDSALENFSKPESEPGVPVQVELNFRIPRFDNPQEVKSSAASEVPSDNTFHANLVSDLSESKPGEAQPETRATNAPLYNLWVFQFSDNGNVRKVVKVSTDDKPIYENQTIEVELLTGSNQTIYMLSLGKRYGEIDFTRIKSLDELEATSFDFIRYENGLPTPVVKNAEDVPYRGSSNKLSIIQLEENGKGYVDYNSSEGFSGAISMKALVSQVTIDFSYQAEKMTPFSISLNNVPTTFAVNNTTHKPNQFVNLPTTILKPADLANGKRVKMSWYVAPNTQGVVSSITSEADRYYYYKANSTVPTGNAPSDGTYIHLWASKDGTPDNYALYYLFLGSNTTNDFNIHPHSHYLYRTDINTADDLNDKRIIYKTLKQSIDFAASDASYPLAPLLKSDIDFDLDAHPSMRPIEITALRGYVSAEILPGSDSGVATTWPKAGVTPIEPTNSWLKLSVYPNYTAALEAYRKGDPNALATSIKLDASIPGLFRLYLYSNEYEKCTQDNSTKDEYKRSLFVRFTFQTETNKSDVYTARMDQRMGFYLGEFGGEPAMKGGEFRYPKGLVIESVGEDKTAQYLSYKPSYFSLYGAYGANSEATFPKSTDIVKYGAYDTYNGRSATKKMAENEYRISPIANGSSNLDKIQEPRYVNGHVDLYQYKYYTKDGFAQRWCYDKNRDSNGNGLIDDNEMVWYMPATWQLFSILLNFHNTNTDYFRVTSPSKGIGVTWLHSTTMCNNTQRMMFNFHGFTVNNNTMTQELTVRCVRDVEPLAGASTGVKYYVEDNYPVIDATGLLDGTTEDRVGNPNVVLVPGVDDDPSYTGRVIRHYSIDKNRHAIDQKVSRRFRVAPCDIDVNGAPLKEGTFKSMTWAEAAGYATEANTLPITENKTAVAETGCAAYKGINGTDGVGKWRLPTPNEVLLIAMMNQGMEADNSVTKYIPLYYLEQNFGTKYWTATEIPDEGTSEYYMNRAYDLYAGGRWRNSGDRTGNNNTWYIYFNKKSSQSYEQTLVRCIYDLH